MFICFRTIEEALGTAGLKVMTSYHLIDKAMTLDPHGINRRDEFN